MSLRRLVLQFVLATGMLSAQPSATPEIRGTVLEQKPDLGLAGAEVVLTEFVPRDKDLDPRVFATVFTDTHGAFSFKPGHLGDFRLNVQKAGYVNTDDPSGNGRGLYLVLTSQSPIQQYSFSLMRPASLTGRVVDEDGKAVANFPISIAPYVRRFAPITRATTDQEGIFNAAGLSPGPYLVRVAPKSGAFESAVDFSNEASKIVDRDFEVSYWPGEAPDARSALPMMVAPGAAASIGTITLRETNYYRVHVSASGDCAPDERWSYAVLNPAEPDVSVPFSSIPCAKDLLFRNFKSGSRMFAIWNQKETDQIRWASAPIEIGSENVHISITMSPGANVPGRLIFPDGAALPPLADTRITLQPEPPYLRVVNTMFAPDEHGRFVARGLPWTRYRVGMIQVPPGYYVKEIRYNDALVPDRLLTLSGVAAFEIVLDDHPATIIGIVVDGDRPIAGANVIVAKWPLQSGEAGSGFVSANAAGVFQLPGLAPGQYRLAAVSGEALSQISGSLDLNSLVSRGERITLDRGSQQNIQLKLIDPSR